MTLREQIDPNERIVWEGNKAKKVSILEGIFNPFLVFALFWGAIDFTILSTTLGDSAGSSEFLFVIPFFAVHLFPVWIYLFGCLTVGLRAKHTHYMITDKNIYIQSGVFSTTTKTSPIADVLHISVHQGFFDKFCGTGDVVFECNHGYYGSHSHISTSISNIEDYERVFRMLKQVQAEVFANQPGVGNPNVVNNMNNMNGFNRMNNMNNMNNQMNNNNQNNPTDFTNYNGF